MKTFTFKVIDDETGEAFLEYCQIGDNLIDAVQRFSKTMIIDLPAGIEKGNNAIIFPAAQSSQQQSRTFKST